MNDLAEKAWHGALAVHRELRRRPGFVLAGAGLLAGAVAIRAGGKVGAARDSLTLTSWLGLQDFHGVAPGDSAPGVALLAAVVVLVLLWLGLVGVVRRHAWPVRRVWWIAGAWTLPFVVGPPLTDTTVYSYVAFGRLARLGRDPYTSGPSSLGGGPLVAAIDPGARGVPSSAGPLGTLLQHLAVSVAGDRAVLTVLVLRLVGLLAAVAVARGAGDLAARAPGAGSRARAVAIALTAANPLMLLYVVSAPHLEGVAAAAVLAALLAADRRRWLAAVSLATLAGCVLPAAFVVVPFVLVRHAQVRRASGRWWTAVVADTGVVAAIVAATGLAVPYGFGWVRTVSAQFGQATPFSVVGGVGSVLTPAIPGASVDDVTAGTRLTALVAMVSVLVYLLVSQHHRPLPADVAFALLAVALLAPVVHPWYLVPGLAVLTSVAVTANRPTPRYAWATALSAAACLLVPPGFSTAVSDVVSAVTLAVVAAGLGWALVRLDRRPRRSPDGDAQRPSAMSRTAGRTSAR